jgi:carbon-monoxide dehydrogenase iron sulfur subunit
MKTVFIHPERCIGCKQCEVACAVAHSQSKNLFWAVFETPTPKPRIHAEPGLQLNTSFPNKCRHCNPAPCQAVCPTAAISRPADHPEIVLIDARRCIACGMCAMACPFDVITYYASAAAPEKSAVAIKCDHCIERQRIGEVPACVEACKVEALEFGELNELVKAARERYSERLLQAVGQQGAPPQAVETMPFAISAYRAWGAAVTDLNADGKKGA